MDGSIEIDPNYQDGACFIIKIKAPLTPSSHCRIETHGHISEADNNDYKADLSNSINLDIDPRLFKASLMSTVVGPLTPQLEELNF